MADVLRAARTIDLPSHPQLGAAILVPTEISSRPFPAYSVLPDRCTVTFDRRIVPGESEAGGAGGAAGGGRRRRRAARRHGRVTIGVDSFDAYTGAPVEAENYAPAWYTGADAPVARAALDGARRRPRALAVLHERQRHGGARHPHDRLRAGRRDARPPGGRVHRARRAAGRSARLRDARRRADGRWLSGSSSTRSRGRSTRRRRRRARWRSTARCPGTRSRRSWTRRPRPARWACGGCW